VVFYESKQLVKKDYLLPVICYLLFVFGRMRDNGNFSGTAAPQYGYTGDKASRGYAFQDGKQYGVAKTGCRFSDQ
jgi:hypothetical protein